MVDIKEPLESQLIAALIEAPELRKAVQLDPSDFVDFRNADLFSALQEIKTDVTPITIAAALEQLGKSFDGDFLEEILQLTPPEITIEDVVERSHKIRENHIRRVTKSKLSAKVPLLSDPTYDVQDTLDTMYQIINGASSSILGQKKPTAPEIIDRLYGQSGSQVRFSSGLLSIDNALTAKGMRQGHVWTLVAPYKGYKTSMVLNIVDSLLRGGKSVSYVALEDFDGAFTEVLTAIDSGVPLGVIEALHLQEKVYYDPAHLAAIQDTEDWLRNTVNEKWRVYDASYGVHNYRRFPTLVASDKMLYNTDVVIVDYLQAWSENREELESIAQMLVEVAAQRQVCIIALSQMSNDSIRGGTHAKELGTKNSGAFGAATHVGIEIVYDPAKSIVRATPEILKEINADKVNHFVSLTSGPMIPTAAGKFIPGPGELTELGLWLKVVRRGRVTRMCVLVDRVSGKVLLQYDNPRYIENW